VAVSTQILSFFKTLLSENMTSFKYLAVLLGCTAAVFGSEFDRRAACNADNCLVALTGKHPGQTQTAADRTGDCSSFFLATVSGSSTIIPTNIPAYASPCSGAVRYSSACSCAGVTGSTTTVTPTTCNPGGPQPTFSLIVADGSPQSGEYGELTDHGYNDVAYFGTSDSSASLFTFNDECNLLGRASGEIANINAGENEDALFFNTALEISESGGEWIPATCNIANDQLSCNDDGDTSFLFCDSGLLIIATSDFGNCDEIELTPLFT